MTFSMWFQLDCKLKAVLPIPEVMQIPNKIFVRMLVNRVIWYVCHYILLGESMQRICDNGLGILGLIPLSKHEIRTIPNISMGIACLRHNPPFSFLCHFLDKESTELTHLRPMQFKLTANPPPLFVFSCWFFLINGIHIYTNTHTHTPPPSL